MGLVKGKTQWRDYRNEIGHRLLKRKLWDKLLVCVHEN